MLRGLLKLLNAEIVFGFLLATIFWIGILGWQAAYAPTEIEKQKCQEAAEHSGHKSEECKTLWERTTSDPVAFFTFWLVISTIGLGASTLMLWGAGEKQFGFLTDNAASQSSETQKAILESARAASAMESVARTIQNNAANQLRAYVSVAVGTIISQTDELNIECQPAVVNTGFTPAYDVIVNSKTDILPYPLPEDFNFDLPDGPDASVSVLGSQQRNFTVSALARKLSDAELVEVKFPGGRRVYNYGRVTYRDLFGNQHYTNFCFYIIWGTQSPVAFTTKRHNDAN